MRTRESLMARAIRRDVADALSPEAHWEEPLAPRLVWAQVRAIGEQTWCLEEDGNFVSDEMLEWTPESITLDSVAEHDLYLRWKTDRRPVRKERRYAQIHDGRFAVWIR